MDQHDAPVPAPGTYRVGTWSANGAIELTAAGSSAQETLQTGLNAILAVVRGVEAGPPGVGETGSEAEPVAVPVRGEGGDVAALFADIAADLLAQLDAHGAGFDRVRLDGLLPTDEGLTAWGYALGVPTAEAPPTGIALAGRPSITQTGGRDLLRSSLRRAGPRA